MKVLHLDGGQRWGGGQNQVRLLMRELSAQGIEQHCVCPQGSPLEARLRAEQLPVSGIRWTAAADVRVAIEIFRHARGADVIHAHDAHALQLGLAGAKLRRIPLIAARRSHFTLQPRTWNMAARVVAVSDAVRLRLLECGVREWKVRTIRSGIDVTEVESLPNASPGMRARLGIAPDAFVAGTVGTLLDYKHQTVMVQAAARARDILWVIVGDGPERRTIEAAIKAHGVAANVRLAGFLTDARPWLREMNLFAFPSKGEALGTSMLDAMALGVPVVAANDAGPAEVLGLVHTRTDASLFPLDDAAALAATVRRIRDDEMLRQKMVVLQRERLRDFRIERVARETLALYREVTAGRRGSLALHHGRDAAE
ncbi:MAG: glycosyltransferase [Gemmatimonadetes bacterium]|nr:glycosyltransferase [Gemmatimonadota bacterium]